MDLGARFSFDRTLTFLNHGSFGAPPREVIEARREIEDRMERDPIDFFLRRLEPLLDESRAALAPFVDAAVEDLAFVPNATTGVNAVLAWFPLRAGDDVLVTDHGYAACTHAARGWAERVGARVVEAHLPFPPGDATELADAVLKAVTPRTRLALLDHVTSPTALVLPLEQILPALHERGVPTLVDGAHGPGFLPLSLRALDADYYVANLHKWCLAPKGAGFLWVNPRRRGTVRPTVLSHGAGSTRTDRPRLHLDFDWTGTSDPSPYLAVPAALRALASLHPGGFPGLLHANRSLALRARDLLTERMHVDARVPAELLGPMVSLPLPPRGAPAPGRPPPPRGGIDALTDWLHFERRVVAPVIAFPESPARLVRVTAHVYNGLTDYERLADALRDGLEVERRGGIA